MLTYFVAALLFFGGVIVIFAREQVWKLTVLSNKMSGRASERTRVWDVSMVIVGVVSIVLAIVVIFLR
ncbi:MAG: hypothetical protein IT327_30690 [Anaerolineae bacterium]|nr:hypothetical protein [Anaerolineae bacterium]